MAKELSDKLNEIECVARKTEAIGNFLYKTEPEDFDGIDDAPWCEAASNCGWAVRINSVKIQELVAEIKD